MLNNDTDISPGRCMPDEASPTYYELLMNMQRGLKLIVHEFGLSARPRVAWSIDPFGHSSAVCTPATYDVRSLRHAAAMDVHVAERIAPFQAAVRSNECRVWVFHVGGRTDRLARKSGSLPDTNDGGCVEAVRWRARNSHVRLSFSFSQGSSSSASPRRVCGGE
jgi:hypothetical protein